MGAIGGGIFQGAGAILDKVADVEQGENNILTKAKDKITSLFNRGLQKERANYVDDKATSQKITDIDFTDQLTDKYNTGKLNEYKLDLENLKKKPDLPTEVRNNLDNYIEDIDFVSTEEAKLKNSTVPSELHKPLLFTKLEQRQNARLSKQLSNDVLNTEQEILKNEELDPSLVELKKLQTSIEGYKRLAEKQPQFLPKVIVLQQQFDSQKVMAEIAFPDLNKALTTSKDSDLYEKAFQLISTKEKQEALKDDLIKLSTPEGIAAYKQEQQNKLIDKEAQTVLANPESTKEQILQAAANTNNQELKIALAKKHQDLVDLTKLQNQEDIKDISFLPELPIENDLIQQNDLPEAPDYSSYPEFIDEPSQEEIDPSQYGIEAPELEVPFAGGLTSEQAQKWGGLSKKQVNDILERVDIEQRTSKPVVNEQEVKKEESIQNNIERTTVPAWLKEINEDGSKTIYTNNITGEKLTAGKVFAIDEQTGQLLANTPRVKVGDIVILKVENDFPYTLTPGFKPGLSSTKNQVINVYHSLSNKPIKQLPSSDNPKTFEEKVIAELRNKVIKQGTFTTTITSKNVGTIRKSNTLNSIETLESDFILNKNNEWIFTKTPHSPIFGYVDFNGNPTAPNVDTMNGVNSNILKDVDNTLLVKRSNDLSKLKGKVVTFRTTPDGTKRIVGLEPRLLNDKEVGWLLNNLDKLIASKDYTTLSDVIHIPQHPAGIYSTKGGKKADLFNNKIVNRTRLHIVNTTKDTSDILIPITGKESKPLWVILDSRQLNSFLNNKQFSFKLFSEDNRSSLITDYAKLQEIVNKFKELLSKQFKNINKDHLNSEIGYTDPTTLNTNAPVNYSSYYDYLKTTNSLQTNTPGSKTLGVGEDSSYSFNQAAVYLDPNPEQSSFNVDENLIIHGINEPVNLVEPPTEVEPQQTSDEEALDELFGPGAKLKPVILDSGFKFNIITDRELQWFKDNIGEQFLTIAKGVDKIIAKGGVEAFGQYHNALVTVAEQSSEGTIYHEAFHFVFDIMLTEKEKAKLLKNNTEEELAEEFEKYKLSNGVYKPKIEQAKGFFRQLLQMIRNLIGLKSPIEKLFSKIDNINISQEQRNQILNKTFDVKTDPKYKKLPGFRYMTQQQQSIQAFSSEVMRLANELARNEDVDLISLFTNEKNINSFFNEVKQNFTNDFNRIVNTEKRSKEDIGRYYSYLAMGIGSSLNEKDKPFIGSFEDTKDTLDFPQQGFKSKVLKDLSRYGFQVRLSDETIYASLDEENQESEDNVELKQEDEAERVYDVDSTLVNPNNSLSQRINLFLANIPEPVLDDKGLPTGEVKKSVFGTTKYLDFKKVAGNLALKLRDSIDPIVRLSELSKNDAISSVVYTSLMNEKNKGNIQLFNEFAAKFNRDGYYKKTVLYGTRIVKLKKDEIDPLRPDIATTLEFYAKTIDSDRASSDRTLHSKWREEAVRKKVIDTDGTVNSSKAEYLNKQLKDFKTKFDVANSKKAQLPYVEVKSKFIDILKEFSIELPIQVWQEFDSITNPGLKYKKLENLFFGERRKSLEWLIQNMVGDSTKDPFEGTSVLTELARISSVYLDDSRGGAFRNEAGNTEYPINYPCALTELINNAKQNPQDVVSYYEQDAFFRQNQFLKSLGTGKVELAFTSASRKDDNDAKEFEQRTEIDSILMRLSTFYNNGGDNAWIFTGTAADKTKQPIVELKKYKGNQAKNFLSTVLKHTVNSEIIRIQRLKGEQLSNEQSPRPIDIKNYNKSDLFKYIPGLNSIPNLVESLSDGTVSKEQFLEANKAVDTVIENFITEGYKGFIEFLINNDVISNKDGNLINNRIPKGLLQGRELESFLSEYFYNDTAWRMEVSKVLMGDFALYSSNDDYFKRAYQIVTPGIKGHSEIPTSVSRMVYKKQIKPLTEEEYNNLVELSNEETANKYRKDGINKTDAQSLITIDAYRTLADSLGLWNKQTHELIYQFAWSKGLTVRKAIDQAVLLGEVTQEQANNIRNIASQLTLQPFKPFQYNNREVKLADGDVLIIKEQFKDSITPITPELASVHSGYRDLLQYIKDNKVDIASAEDTLKVGSYGVSDLSSSLQPWQKRVINLEDFRFPQLMPEKKKEEISGTQLHKLILGNINDNTIYKVGKRTLTGLELKKEYNELWANKIEQSSSELQSKLGLDSNFKLSEDKKKRKDQVFKLKTVLQQELTSRDLNENYEDLLELVHLENGEVDFTVPLSFPAFGQKFQSILSNLWKKNVLKQKSEGYSTINLADFGVGYADELAFMKKDEESGEHYSEIGLPIDYLKEVGLKYGEHILPNGKIMWNKLNNNQKEALQFIVYRIPTSNKSSMLPVRVAMITPPQLNNIVIIPGELTIQQGLDFDVDKSQLLKKVLTKEGKIDNEAVDTNLFNLYWSILNNPVHTQEVLTPLSSPILVSKVKEYQDKGLVDNGGSESVFLPQSDIKAEVRNKDGKAEIGVASRYNTGHSVMQIIKDYIGVNASININTGSNYKFNELGRQLDANGKFISENHAESQQAALDAAKEPLLAFLNVVTGTMAAFHTMIDFGVPLNVITDFFMQPVIREWTRFYKQEGGREDKATEKLLKIYPNIKNQLTTLKDGDSIITETSLSKNVDSEILDNSSNDAIVLKEFLNILALSKQLTKINNVLSLDTFQDATGLEALEAVSQQIKDVTNPEAQVYIDPRIFNLETTPPEGKRLAAFYSYGIQGLINYISQFFPAASLPYKQVKDEYTNAIGLNTLTDKRIIKQLNQFTDYYNLEGDSLLTQTLDKIYPQALEKKTESTYDKWVQEANSRSSIPQNLQSGVEAFGTKQEAVDKIKVVLGSNPRSIEMIQAGFRTRTTRSVGEVEKYKLNVGDYVWQYGKTTTGSIKILTKITDVYGQEDNRFKNNWYKEGWTSEGVGFLDRLKPGAKAIEFEVVTKQVNNTKGNDYKSRWSFFSPDKSMWNYINQIVDKYPALKNNELIKNLEKERYGEDKVQMVGVRNTNNNTNKSEITNGWYEMLHAQSLEVRGLAHDLIRFAIFTSGFNYNQRSMFDLIPIQFWVESGLSDYWRSVIKEKDSIGIDKDGVVTNFVRHNFKTIDRFPELYQGSDSIINAKYEANTKHLVSFTLGENYTSNITPSWFRIYDNNLNDYRLYQGNPANKKQFKEVQPLGESKGYYEISSDGKQSSKNPKNKKLNLSSNPWNKIDPITKSYPLFDNSNPDTNIYISTYLTEEVNNPKSVLEKLLANEVDIQAKKDIQRLLDNVDKINTSTQIAELNKQFGVFEVKPDGSSVIKINKNSNVESDSQMRHVLLHELNHAYSVSILQNPQGEQQVNFIRNVERIRVDAVKQFGEIQGLENKFEFVAELASNKEFRQKLKKTDLWSRIIRAFRKLFGQKDIYDKTLDTYYSILDDAETLQNLSPAEFALKQEIENKTKAKKQGKKRLDTLEEMMASIKSREGRLRRQGKKLEAEALLKNIEILQTLGRNEQTVRFCIIAEEELAKLKEVYSTLSKDPSKINPDILLPIIEQLTSYKLLNSFERQISRSPEQFIPEGGDPEQIKTQLRGLISEVANLTYDIEKLAVDHWASVIVKNNEDERVTLDDVKDELSISNRDITWISRFQDVGREMRDMSVKTAYKLISDVNAKAWRKTQDDLYITEPKEQTTKLVVKVPNSNNPGFHNEVEEIKFTSVGKFKALKDFEEMNKNTKTSFADKFAEVLDSSSFKEGSDGIRFVSPFSKKGKEILSIKLGDNKYPLKQFYETFVLGYLKDQESIPAVNMRPGLRIPTMGKSLLESVITAKGLGKLEAIRQQALNEVRRRYDETDYYAVDEDGERQNYVPIRFVAKQDGLEGRLSTREVSLDIPTILTIFSNEMNTRQGMESIVSDLEIGKTVLANRKVLVNTKLGDYSGIGGLLTSEREGNLLESGAYETQSGIKSNSYEAFDTALRRQVYGQSKKEEGAFSIGKNKFSFSKVIDTLLKYTGFNIMFGNIAIPLTNAAVGKLTMFKEVVGGNVINWEDLRAGDKTYREAALASIKDLNKREKTTKWGRVFTYLNPFEHESIHGLGTDTNILKTVLDKIIKTGGSTIEYYLTTTAMGATFNRFKVLNTKTGKKETFYNGIEVSNTGKIQLNSNYTYKGKKELTDKDLTEIKDYALRVYQLMHGVYNRSDKAAANEYVIGRLINFMRSWLVPGINTRFRTKFYDDRLKMDNEGHYLSALVVFNNIFTSNGGLVQNTLDTLKVLTWFSASDPNLLLHPNEMALAQEEKDALINLRKANIKKTLFEVYLMVASGLLLALGWDDDEESYTRYMLARVRRELVTFISPSTAFDVLKSPTVAMHTLDGMSRIIYDTQNSLGSAIMGEDQPVYESGPGKGQNKLWFDIKRQTGFNFATQFDDLQTKTRLIERGRR